jgi:hypothetical protein
MVRVQGLNDQFGVNSGCGQNSALAASKYSRNGLTDYDSWIAPHGMNRNSADKITDMQEALYLVSDAGHFGS